MSARIAKGFLYLKGNYYTPEEWDRLYMRVDDDRPAQEESDGE